jgi:hypothetical protein
MFEVALASAGRLVEGSAGAVVELDPVFVLLGSRELDLAIPSVRRFVDESVGTVAESDLVPVKAMAP